MARPALAGCVGGSWQLAVAAGHGPDYQAGPGGRHGDWGIRLTLTWREGLSMEMSCSQLESSQGMAGYLSACCVITTRSGCLSRCASIQRQAIAFTMPASKHG